MRPGQITARLKPHAPSAVPGLAVVALMLVWAVHDGGYDSETWYWGALAALALLAATIVGLGARVRCSRAGGTALALLALYVAWSYLSIAWAQSPGDALQGSNRALLYLLLFALMLILPWTPQGALLALAAFAIGVGVAGVVLLLRLASEDRVAGLVIQGRLSSPTGYFNATAALFTIESLAATVLATRRELPAPVRGLLLAIACAGLQLALIVQSRGWLFTLPLVALLAVIVAPDRLRVTLAVIVPLAGALVPLHRLLDVYQSSSSGPAALQVAAGRAGQAALLMCGGAFVLGTLLAWGDTLLAPRSLSHRRRRIIGGALIAVALAAVLGAGTVATHGHPVRFVSRQWNGFSRPQQSYSTRSHFADVGSGRYDFWRVSLDALLAHPIGGLGQDNFADYYVLKRRTAEEPSWTHSLEMRLLAHTGLVGFALFASFLVAALIAAVRRRRRGPPLARAVAGIALLPLAVWLIHGSVDWFWEIPALAGPALGFLGMAGAVGRDWDQASGTDPHRGLARNPLARAGLRLTGALALVGGVIVLGFPYLSTREVSLASDVRTTNPAAALGDLNTAAELDPLSAVPGRIAGAIALQSGQYPIALVRFRQSIAREPGGWFAWLGAGLAASATGDRAAAHHDFAVAYSINSRQPAVIAARARVDGLHPLTSAEAFRLLILVQ